MKWRGVMAALLIAGCTPPPPPPPPAAPPPTAATRAVFPSPTADGRPQPDAPPVPGRLINVMMYQFTVPYASVSANDQFWKRVTEDVVDVPTHDRLYFNGLRIGRARISDWPAFKDVLDKQTTMVKTTRFVALPGEGDVALNMTPVLTEQLLAVFGEHGATLRWYDECQNRIYFSFRWEPQDIGTAGRTVRVTLCPVVAAIRARMDYLLSDNPVEQRTQDLEHRYDLGLTADMAPGEFLVLGISPAASDPDRLGTHFLVEGAATQKTEQVLVLVGQQVKLQHARPATRPAGDGPT